MSYATRAALVTPTHQSFESPTHGIAQRLPAGVPVYLSKPFNPRELVARINAVLRRRSPARLREIRQHNQTLGPLLNAWLRARR